MDKPRHRDLFYWKEGGGENLNSAPASSGPVQWLLPAARAHQPKAKRELPLLQLSQVLTPHSRPYYLGRVFPTTKREPPKNQSRDSKRRKSSGLSVRERVLQRGCGYGVGLRGSGGFVGLCSRPGQGQGARIHLRGAERARAGAAPCRPLRSAQVSTGGTGMRGSPGKGRGDPQLFWGASPAQAGDSGMHSLLWEIIPLWGC